MDACVFIFVAEVTQVWEDFKSSTDIKLVLSLDLCNSGTVLKSEMKSKKALKSK